MLLYYTNFSMSIIYKVKCFHKNITELLQLYYNNITTVLQHMVREDLYKE